MSHRVAFVVYPDFQLLDMSGPVDLFDAAGRIAGTGLYDSSIVSAKGGGVRSLSGIEIGTVSSDTLLRSGGSVDTLIVPGTLDEDRLLDDSALLETIRVLAAGCRRVAAVCTGSFALGALGLIDGKRVTTHWAKGAELATRFPKAVVRSDRIFIRDGELYTSGGVASGLDLALALISDDHGRALARTVAKWMVIHLQRPGNQSQFGVTSRLPPDVSPRIDAVVQTVTSAPAEDHSVPRLAARIGVSRRHFARLFLNEVGITPARFVESVRLDLAKSLLEEGSAGNQTIATMCGFSTAEALRQSFRRSFGVSPESYRLTFGTDGPT